MPKIYDEQVDFTTISVASNQKDAASIQPIVGGENLWENVLNRTPENLRLRSESLRTAVEDLKYYADYDRAFVLRAEATTFSCVNDTDGYRLVMTGGPLWIYPALTPGQKSGGRLRGARMFIQNGSWVPYAGTLGTNDLSFVATGEFTGMRGYAESDDMAAGSFTVGGNRLRISLVANPAAVGGPASISATVTGAPATLITITYGTLTTSTTINEIIAWITADLNSQGSYGLAHMLRGVTTSAGTSAPPAITNGVFQGGYDAEAHQITNFVPFFNVAVAGTFVNRLKEGESLALAFVPGPVEAATGATGGRRQALIDLPVDRIGGNTDNTNSNAILFNTGREPEKIPGSIPIGKLLNGKFVFIDGTAIGTSPISLGESGVTLARLAAPTGGAMVGYDGSGNWNPDASTNPALVSTTVGAALDEIVTRLGGYTASDSGARRIGMENVSGVSSDGNAALDLTAGITSLRNALTQILNAVGSATAPGGVNARVSEYGHRMQGFNPIEKVFSATSPVATDAGGAELIRAVLNQPKVDLFTAPHREERVISSLLPIFFDTGTPGEVLQLAEPIQSGATAATVKLSSLTNAAALIVRDLLVLTESAPELHTLVQIKGSVADDGFYFAKVLTPGAPPSLSLYTLDGAVWTGGLTLAGPATLTFYASDLDGNSKSSVRVRRTVPENLPEAHEHVYGSGVIRRGYDRTGTLRFEESVSSAKWGLNFLSSTGHGAAGATLTFSAAGLGLITVSGLTGMVTGAYGSVGHYLTISGATGGAVALNGSWRISSVATSAQVTIETSAVVSGAHVVSWVEEYDQRKSTANILMLDDARLLNGISTGTPVDASANHHHDGRYTATTIPILSVIAGNLSWTHAGGTLVTAGSIDTGLGSEDFIDVSSLAPYVPAGFRVTGVYLELLVTVSILPGSLSGSPWSWLLQSSPGTVYNSSDSRVLFQESGYKINGTGTGDTLNRCLLVFVKTDSSNNFCVLGTASAAIDVGATVLSVRPSALVCVPV